MKTETTSQAVKNQAVKFISENEMIAMFMSLIGSAFMQVVSLTTPKTLKKSRITKLPTPFEVLQHVKNFGLQIGYNYEKQNNNNAESEGMTPDFVAQVHKWAKHVKGAVFCRQRDEQGTYIAYAQKNVAESVYFADGAEINLKDYSEYLPESKPYENQPAEKKVRVQFIKAENILSFTFNGTLHYVMR